ncbi:hypothetical protein ACGFW5_21060 [Streptomyces sp. NPDC048416]|uniref:hypothetical protein n=1 Tax=Streptomyces sp. NPDC048416 TaxID=3365546 RepID=UPI0037143A93
MRTRSTAHRAATQLTAIACTTAVLLLGLVLGASSIMGGGRHTQGPASRDTTARRVVDAGTDGSAGRTTVVDVDFRWDGKPTQVRD